MNSRLLSAYCCALGVIGMLTGSAFAQSVYEDLDNDNAGSSVQDQHSIEQRMELAKDDLPGPASTLSYKVAAEVPDVPKKVFRYRTVRPSMQDLPKQDDKMMKTLGFEKTGRAIHKIGNQLSVDVSDDTGRVIEYFESGAVFYRDSDFMSEESSEGVQAADSQYYAQSADNFLSEAGLLKDGIILDKVSSSTTNVLDTASQTVNDRITGSSVHYGYEIDGIKAWGPGAKINVYLNNAGKVTGVYSAIRNVVPDSKKVKIKDASAAIDDYVKYGEPKSLLRTYTGQVTEVSIDNVDLVYYMQSAAEKQDIVEPMYLISGHFTGKDEKGAVQQTDFEWLEDAME